MTSKETNNLVLVHGWALGGFFFEPLFEYFPTAQVRSRNYFRDEKGEQLQSIEITEGSTVITHSLGLHFLGSKDFSKIKNLVICGGFLNFHQGPSKKAVRRMLKKLESTPNIVLEDFYKALFFPDPPLVTPPELANLARLKADLEFLNQSMLEPAMLDPVEKILILSGNEDMVTPVVKAEELQAAIPRVEIKIQEGWGHGFLYQHPKDCAEIITRFITS